MQPAPLGRRHPSRCRWQEHHPSRCRWQEYHVHRDPAVPLYGLFVRLLCMLIQQKHNVVNELSKVMIIFLDPPSARDFALCRGGPVERACCLRVLKRRFRRQKSAYSLIGELKDDPLTQLNQTRRIRGSGKCSGMLIRTSNKTRDGNSRL